MKRGRPRKRHMIQQKIVEVLSSGAQMTTTAITNKISQQVNKQVSWNTVNKYLQELVQLDKITATKLPHSKDESKQGLTVYTLKK